MGQSETSAGPATRAYVALGANLGIREENIAAAIKMLDRTPGVTVTLVSPLLENPAVGGPPGAPAFLNAVAEIDTTLGPRELLARLLEIEKQLGRARERKWEPRVIDLDLILYGDQIISSPDLTVPHPRMHERRFVLEPLAQIAPDVVHPVLRKSAAELLRNL